MTLEPPRDPDHVSSFLNIRVTDIHAVYQQWRDRGAQFLTPPTDRGPELRCYIRDPDGRSLGQGRPVLSLNLVTSWAKAATSRSSQSVSRSARRSRTALAATSRCCLPAAVRVST